MILRPDLLDDAAPQGAEVVQLTTADRPSAHIYMEAQIFTPDSRRFVLHNPANSHGITKGDPEHRFLVCDLADAGKLSPITNELAATGPAVSPDGTMFYYVIDELTETGGRFAIKCVGMDGSDRRTIVVVDSEFAGTGQRPAGRIYPLSTIRSDGRRLAVQTGLRNIASGEVSFGLVVFDLATGGYELIHTGRSWHNMHPQYSRSLDAQAMHDIMIQHNHSIDDKPIDLLRPDIHLIRDDGSDLRDFPCSRDGEEGCHGHQCWRGRTTWAVIGTGTFNPNVRHLVECQAVPAAGHLGSLTPGAKRNMLSRPAGFPRTAHFGIDIAGKRLVTDAEPYDIGGRIILMDLGEPGVDPASNLRPLAWTRTADVNTSKATHPHPFLSPDGKMAFFNSSESGVVQAYMIRNL